MGIEKFDEGCRGAAAPGGVAGLTLAEIREGLSAAAREVLAGAPSARIGTRVPFRLAGDHLAAAVLAELVEAGLVGSSGGLTVAGSAIAERLQRERLDALFGAL